MVAAAVVVAALAAIVATAHAMGALPDASQEGLVDQYTGYASMPLFHFTVPPETARATWEFASFQDRADCPRRTVQVRVQHAGYPVFNGDNASFPDTFYLPRSSAAELSVESEYQPTGSAVLPVYNPLPGSWFAVAYLQPFEENTNNLRKRCRYSLGSIALWSKADGVELIMPNTRQTFRTKRQFSYYKFYVPDDVDLFRLEVGGCKSRIKHPRPEHNQDVCIEFVDIRASALPFHRPDSESAKKNIAPDSSKDNSTAVFVELRPYKATTYYLLVVSQGEVSFDVELTFVDCGEVGLYGRQQRDWYLSERGLVFAESQNASASQPKEPLTGFQLLSTRPKNKLSDDNITSAVWSEDSGDEIKDSAFCYSTFDFNRIESVTEFTANYLLQGKSWYTKWLTVLEREPLLTRFETLDFLDLGGFLNIRLMLDDRTVEAAKEQDVYQVITACLEKGRQPDMQACRLESADRNTTIVVSSQNGNSTSEALKVIPYPEPGKWYLGFQVDCASRRAGRRQPCPALLREAMVSVEMHLQPCDYRPINDICGRNGLCAMATKGQFRLSTCTCLAGYAGWTCDDVSQAQPVWKSMLDTLLLTLSNFCFLPAVLLALYYRLFTEALVYGATMFFSTFYHTCDREALTMTLPKELESACMALYINKEVLQFCDFFCATLSFWITIIALAGLPSRLVNLLNMFGVLLVAVLVQYNRTGLEVFAIPIPLGVLALALTLAFKSWRRRRLLRPNRYCAVLLTISLVCCCVALALVAFVETDVNYAYVHSTWHALMATALVVLLPRCRRRSASSKVVVADHAVADHIDGLCEVVAISSANVSDDVDVASTASSNSEEVTDETSAGTSAEDNDEADTESRQEEKRNQGSSS